jgi:hypothetical protein
MEEFKKALEAAAEASCVKHRNAADHVIRQAFYDGVRFYMEYGRQATPQPPPAANEETPPA